MATVLLAWELGAGFGHLGSLVPLATRLSQRGHRVFVALRDLSRAEAVFCGRGVSYLQAPHRTRRADDGINPMVNYAHILHNIGFGNLDELAAMTAAWRNLYDYVQPDLVIFDHSPTALLAVRGYPARRAIIGTGFCCPVDQYPFPSLRPGLNVDTERLRRDEDQLLEHVNRLLVRWGQAPLERLGQLYSEVDETFLTTFEELDHYPGRVNGRYWGGYPILGTRPPEWPEGPGKRLYAYLNPFPALVPLLELLGRLGFPTIVYINGVSADRLRKRFPSATLHFVNEPLDLRLVGQQCDLGILNGGHGTTVSLLLAGKPLLLLPTHLEQSITTRAVVRLGAGLGEPPFEPDRIAEQLQLLLTSEQYVQAARRFAERYASFGAAQQIERMVFRAEQLACGWHADPTVFHTRIQMGMMATADAL